MVNGGPLKYFLIFFLLMAAHVFSYCQVAKEVTGSIKGDSLTISKIDTITLKRLSDPLIQYTTQQLNAKFTFNNIPFGTYELTFLVDTCLNSATITINKDSIQLAPQEVYFCGKLLQGVTIVSDKPKIEHKIDRVIFNVNKSVLAQNSNLWDMLRLIPNVRTQPGGGVNVGEKSATVYIDDVQTQLSGEDLANFLRGYNASSIEKIEVFDVPPSKYDANGGAVINIILKRKLKDGIFGDAGITYEQSTYSRQQGSLNLNGKFKRLDFFLNGSQSLGKYLTTDKEYIRYNTAGLTSNWDIDSRLIEKRPSGNLVAGLRYLLSRHSSLSVQATKSYIKNSGENNIGTIIKSSDKLDSLINTQNNSAYRSDYTNITANYKAEIDTAGGNISITANQLWYNIDPSQYLNSVTYNEVHTPVTNYSNSSTSLQNTKVSSFQFDFSKKYGTILVDAGLKTYFVKTTSDRTLTDYGNAVENLFIYKENNEAAYLSLYRSWGKFSAKLGIRGEYTKLNIDSKGPSYDSTMTNDYFRLFPTVYLDYSINDANRLILSANKRIVRPEYYRLNPFTYFTTPYYTASGNPYLKPSNLSTLNLDYITKNNYTFSAFYTHATDKFTNITIQDNQTKIFRDIQSNIGLSKSIGASFYCDLYPVSFWQMSHFIRLAYKTEKGIYENQPFAFHKFVYYYSLDQSWTMDKKKTWLSELHFYFASPTIQGIFNNAEMYNLSAGLRKKVKNLSFFVSVNDIFFKDYSRIHVNYLDQNNGFTYKNDSRSFVLGIRYSFNKKKDKNREIEKLENGNEVERVINSK